MKNVPLPIARALQHAGNRNVCNRCLLERLYQAAAECDRLVTVLSERRAMLTGFNVFIHPAGESVNRRDGFVGRSREEYHAAWLATKSGECACPGGRPFFGGLSRAHGIELFVGAPGA